MEKSSGSDFIGIMFPAVWRKGMFANFPRVDSFIIKTLANLLRCRHKYKPHDTSNTTTEYTYLSNNLILRDSVGLIFNQFIKLSST
jgi:hypothetical protein